MECHMYTKYGSRAVTTNVDATIILSRYGAYWLIASGEVSDTNNFALFGTSLWVSKIHLSTQKLYNTSNTRNK
jgi:hypothetical protein